jgi:pyridoxine 5-phosphate synthase
MANQNGEAKLRLGVNVDHVATIRNARGGGHPDPVRAATMAAHAGADSIVAHLREDRRHVTEDDLDRLTARLAEFPDGGLPLTREMAATDEMLSIALDYCPHSVCIVPERREELTTEGGLDAAQGLTFLSGFVESLSAAGIRVSLFIDPELKQLEAAKQMGAPAVELHTGSYCDAPNGVERDRQLSRIADAVSAGDALGLAIHAGHGLTFDTVGPIAALLEIEELNIGHFLIGEAIYSGLDSSIRRMRSLMDQARSEALGRQIA